MTKRRLFFYLSMKLLMILISFFISRPSFSNEVLSLESFSGNWNLLAFSGPQRLINSCFSNLKIEIRGYSLIGESECGRSKLSILRVDDEKVRLKMSLLKNSTSESMTFDFYSNKNNVFTLVSDTQHKGVWLLSRKTSLSTLEFKSALSLVKSKGIEIKKLELVL